MLDRTIRILLIVLGAVLILLNIIAVINGASIEAIAGLVVVAVGGGVLIYQFRRQQFTSGRWGCSNCWLPILAFALLLRGGYSGASLVREGLQVTPTPEPPPGQLSTRPLAFVQPTSTPRGTEVRPTITPFPTATLKPCIAVKQVTVENAGENVCFYGIVENVSRDDLAQYVDFLDTDFRLVTYDTNIRLAYVPGQCVQQTGDIDKLGNRPIMVFDANAIFATCSLSQPQSP